GRDDHRHERRHRGRTGRPRPSVRVVRAAQPIASDSPRAPHLGRPLSGLHATPAGGRPMTDWDITAAMIGYGGSFVAGLGKLFRQADAINQAKLKATFPE